MRLQSNLGKEFAQQLRASSLSEIATWCEMSAKGLGNTPEERADANTFLTLAASLRTVALDAYRKEGQAE